MKTIVVLSDTHGNLAPLERISAVLAECDYILHLGDTLSDMRGIFNTYPEKTYLIAGNNDFCGESEIVLDVEGCRIFACHGHLYGVKSGKQKLAEAAKSRGCDIALFGHTHQPFTGMEEGVLCVNPGCMTRFAPSATYCYLVIHGKKAVPTLVEIPHGND